MDCKWSINGVALTQPSSTITVDGAALSYTINGRRIALTSSDLREIKFSLELLAVGDNNQTARASRCITLQAARVVDERFIPPYAVFQRVQKEQFGNIATMLPVVR